MMMMKSGSFHSHLLSLVLRDDHRAESTLWFSSILLGLLACKTIYNLMRAVSSCFPQYTRLSKLEKVEWDNRGFSTAHAIAISAAASHFLLFSDFFKDDAPYGPILLRRSLSSEMILGMSVGYFISDLAMILWFYPRLGGVEYVLHHLLSTLSLTFSAHSGEGNFYVYMVLLSEVTTPFVNLRWYLSVVGLKKTKAYMINGIILFFGWMMARVLLFLYLFIHLYQHFNQVREFSVGPFYCLMIVPPCLGGMNLVWFFKIARGMVKTLAKRA